MMPKLSLVQFRLIGWTLIAFFLFIAVVILSPQQAPVMSYKLALATVATVVGYRVDRSLFPYARPHDLIANANANSDQPCSLGVYRLASAAMLRRAIIVAAFVVGVSLAL